MEALRLLNNLFSDPDGRYLGRFLEITYIHPKPPRGWKKIIVQSLEIGKENPDFRRIHDLNAAGYGVYYGVAPRDRRVGNFVERTDRHGRTYVTQDRGREEDVTLLNALWAEIDAQEQGRDKEQVYDQVTNMTLLPPVMIDSGGGLHLIWPILPHPVQNIVDVKLALRGLALAVGGDTSVAELARVLRLPGTVNTKPSRGGAACKVLFLLDGARYRWEDFAEFIALARPTVEPTPCRPMPRMPRRSAEQPGELPGYVRWYLDTTHAVGERNNSLNWVAYKMHCDGYSQHEAEALLLPRALADGLGKREIMRTIESAFSAKRGAPSYISKSTQRRMAAGDVARRAMRQRSEI